MATTTADPAAGGGADGAEGREAPGGSGGAAASSGLAARGVAQRALDRRSHVCSHTEDFNTESVARRLRSSRKSSEKVAGSHGKAGEASFPELSRAQ